MYFCIKGECYIAVTRASFLQTKVIKLANVPGTVLTNNRERFGEAEGNSDRVENTCQFFFYHINQLFYFGCVVPYVQEL
jgi:hypothetical protein